MRRNFYINDDRANAHLDRQGNMSAYLTDLILRDIEQEENRVVTRDDVVAIVQQFIGAGAIVRQPVEDCSSDILNSIMGVVNNGG